MMLTLAKVSPRAKAASASDTSWVAVAVKVPRWYTSRTTGAASTVNQARNGSETKTIWRTPIESVSRKRPMSFCAANRESDGNSTVPIVTAKIPCGS
jgi:hypothetical protein